MSDSNKSFEYSYSAREQAEIKKIREKYAPQESENSSLEQLRRLDAGVSKKATTASLILGILGSLILGTGMSLAMTDLGSILGLGSFALFAGITIGLAGMVMLAFAYPLYMHILKKERKRIAPEIIRLSDELLK